MAKSVKDLNDLYRESETCDKDLLSEMRTNLQLVSGDHYNRQGSRYWNRIREAKQLAPEIRLRITKNHIGKITKLYINSIQTHSPGVTIVPKNESEIQDQKAAEQHEAVWQDIKHRHKIQKRIRTWIKDYVEIGEVCCKVFWDPNAGVQTGWEQEVDEFENLMFEQGPPDPMTGAPTQGAPVQSDTPVMSGDLVFETIHGFDLRRDSNIKNMDEAPWLGYAKMVPMKEMQSRYKGTDKAKFIQESTTDTFRVFEGSNNSYKNTKDLTQIREFYYKPCVEFPKGYFYIFTELGILEEGELPFGIFPIVYEGFDEITTSARHYSIIRQLRPYQIEINRAASKVAEHQITVGDTKVFLLSGSKPSSGVNRPGIRYETITGQPPVVVPGQVGEQYIPYIDSQIKEMYMVADLADEIDKDPTQIEAYALLFRSLKQKKKFVLYAEKFEGFLVDIAHLSLSLMKKYAPPELFVNMVGKNEQVNVAEFKSSTDLKWQIKVEPQTDDIETKFGKQLVLNNIIQYAGNNVDPKDLGMFIRMSPYLNNERMLSKFTADWDNAQNDILALDRGEYPPPQKYENHEYLLEAITNRVKQPDFRFKPPQIQNLYYKKIQEHEEAIAIKAQQIQLAESGFIPTTGYQVAADFYVPDPKNPQSSKRVRIPSDSLQWLLKKIQDQGTELDSLQGVPQQAMADMGQMIHPQGQAAQSPQLYNSPNGKPNFSHGVPPQLPQSNAISYSGR